MSLHSLPLFVRMAGRPVILLGDGEAAAAKRRLLERAGAEIVDETDDAVIAIVAVEDRAVADAATGRLRARGILVNTTDRPDLCDFTLPAIVDRDPVVIAIGTGGASAGLAAALRQRLETILPATLGPLAGALSRSRAAIQARFGGHIETRRRALAAALSEGGPLDPMIASPDAVERWLDDSVLDRRFTIRLRTDDPDDLTLREARWLALADRVYHTAEVPFDILTRARADAPRIVSSGLPAEAGPGLTVYLEMV